MQNFILIVTAAILFNNNAFAQQFSSGDERVALIELYTSEGCSSCPPADRWMSKLKSHNGLWSDFVPLAFHVDYWDYIGWPDRFASPEYSQRQRRYARENRERTVYTPGVRKSGEEFRAWRSDSPVAHSVDSSSQTVGQLAIDIMPNGAFDAKFSGRHETNARVLNVALLGLELETEVKRGENRGKHLEHDFVVLGLSRFSSATKNSWSGQLSKPAIEARKYAVAVWVSDGRSVAPIQATGGYLAKDFTFE